MAVKIQMRRDTVDNWEEVNPILSVGEWGVAYEEDHIVYIRMGDGIHHWADLETLAVVQEESESTFSWYFSVPEEDVYDEETGFKLTHNQPFTGMVTVALYDLGVTGPPDKLSCRVYNRDNGSLHTDWESFAPWGTGLFCGTAAVNDNLTITIYGPWNED